ncbi:MAG: hypothetical protein WDA07_14230 [Leucobacter sp.]
MTYTPRHYTSKLMHGIAERIHTAGLAVYRPNGTPYTSSERGIYFDHSPAPADAHPVETCVITPYMPQSGDLAIEHTRVQIRARHVGRHTLWIRDWLDDMRALFPDKTHLVIGGLQFDRVRQSGSTSWGEPTRQNQVETTQNFAFRGNRYD